MGRGSVAWAWRWAHAQQFCSTTLGTGAKEGSTGSPSPREGQTQTPQAEEVALGEDGWAEAGEGGGSKP